MSEPAIIRVVVVDDHPLAHGGMRFFLNAYPDLELVGAAHNGREALELVERVRPDVVLMDIMMPGMDGIETTRLLRQQYPQLKVLALTSYGEGDLVNRALRAGACGYLLKSVAATELVQAIRSAYAGRTVLTRDATDALVAAMQQRPSGAAELSEREREVLQLLAQGLANLQIADRLHISRATVKFHISSIFAKLGVATRAEAVALAYQRNMFS